MSAGSRISLNWRMWSGEMKPIEPPMSPWRVRVVRPSVSAKLLARPKSVSFTRGRCSGPKISRFEGFTSRWT